MEPQVKIRKSIPLTKEQFSAFKKFVKAHHTKTDAANALGIEMHILNRVMLSGSGREDTIKNIIRLLEIIEA